MLHARKHLALFIMALSCILYCWLALNANDNLDYRKHVFGDGKLKREKIRQLQKGNRQQLRKGNDKEQYMNILLLGYARGGTTYVGQILGYKPDTFYFYEPLFEPGNSLVYHHNGSECRINNLSCRPYIRYYLRKLRALFACNPQTFNVLSWQKKHGGLAWRKYGNKKGFLNLHSICKRSVTRVAKVLRASAEYVEDLLIEDPSLKVIYLYRDPRGTVNSRLQTRLIKPHWKADIKSVKGVAEGLCHKMEIDSDIMFKLHNKYPDRAFLISYEDIVENPKEAVASMFSLLGKNVSEKYLAEVAKMGNKSSSNDKDYNSAFRSNGTAIAYKWKTDLSPEEIEDIDQSCVLVYKRLGYITLNDMQ